jgi:hypothetical protein
MRFDARAVRDWCVEAGRTCGPQRRMRAPQLLQGAGRLELGQKAAALGSYPQTANK